MSEPTLLVVDIGNTNVSIGIFDYEAGKGSLAQHWRTSTHREQTSDELAITLRSLLTSEGRAPSEISNVMADDRINIVAASVKVHKDHRATIQATLEVSSVAQLSRVMAHLEQLKDVYSVQRNRT